MKFEITHTVSYFGIIILCQKGKLHLVRKLKLDPQLIHIKIY